MLFSVPRILISFLSSIVTCLSTSVLKKLFGKSAPYGPHCRLQCAASKSSKKLRIPEEDHDIGFCGEVKTGVVVRNAESEVVMVVVEA